MHDVVIYCKETMLVDCNDWSESKAAMKEAD